MPTRKVRKPRGTKKGPHGGKPGNTNALTHGFYSPRFLANEAKDLDGFSDESLASEMAMMRVAVRRVFVVFGASRSVTKQIALLGALGAASSRVASLLKTRKFLAGGVGDTFSGLAQAIIATREILKIGEGD